MPVSIRSCAGPVVTGESAPSRSRYPAREARAGSAGRSSGSSSASARSTPASSAASAIALGGAGRVVDQRGEGIEVVGLIGVRADLAGVAQPDEPLDLALALDAGRVILGQPRDEVDDAVAQLQREVRGGGAHERPHVLDGDRVAVLQALGVLGLAHDCWGWALAFTGTISSSESRRDWSTTEIAPSSPMIQPWL